MPGKDQTDDRLDTPDQGRVSRRSVLGAAGVGAAGLAAGALGLAAAAPAAAKTARPASAARPGTGSGDGERPDSAQQVVVHVQAGGGGELDVFSGTSHTRVQDAELAARLRRMTR